MRLKHDNKYKCGYKFDIGSHGICDAVIVPNDITSEENRHILDMGFTLLMPFTPNLQRQMEEIDGRLYVRTDQMKAVLQAREDYLLGHGGESQLRSVN